MVANKYLNENYYITILKQSIDQELQSFGKNLYKKKCKCPKLNYYKLVVCIKHIINTAYIHSFTF
jgi:hypothetical protein